MGDQQQKREASVPVSEFANVEDALEALVVSAVVTALTNEDNRNAAAREQIANGKRARAWLGDGIRYAQAHGWPGAPMMTRREVLKWAYRYERAGCRPKRKLQYMAMAHRETLGDGDAHNVARELALEIDAERTANNHDS